MSVCNNVFAGLRSRVPTAACVEAAIQEGALLYEDDSPTSLPGSVRSREGDKGRLPLSRFIGEVSILFTNT